MTLVSEIFQFVFVNLKKLPSLRGILVVAHRNSSFTWKENAGAYKTKLIIVIRNKVYVKSSTQELG